MMILGNDQHDVDDVLSNDQHDDNGHGHVDEEEDGNECQGAILVVVNLIFPGFSVAHFSRTKLDFCHRPPLSNVKGKITEACFL